jgi:hypothetical protein
MTIGYPVDVANLALDACGYNMELGNLEQGGREANLLLRAYGRCREDLLRGAPWGFARKQVPLFLLADSSGVTPNVGTQVPGTNFQYEYAYPTDCQRIRYIPWKPYQNPGVPPGNIQPPNPNVPPTTGGNPAILWQPIRPSQFLVTNDPNFSQPVAVPYQPTHGSSPIGSTVILSNVQNASLVYTFDATYPSLWDQLFTSAMIAYLASEVCWPLWSSKNPKLGLAVRKDQIAIAKAKITEARIADGNEMTVSSDIQVDWMRFRNTLGGNGIGGDWSSDGATWGCWGGGWSGSVGFSDGSSF